MKMFSWPFAFELGASILFYAILSTALSLISLKEYSQLAPVLPFVIGMFVAQGLALYFFRRGHNWARIVFAIFAILALTGLPALIQPPTPAGVFLAGCTLSLNILWLYVSFFTSVRFAFHRRAQTIDYDPAVPNSLRATLLILALMMSYASWKFSADRVPVVRGTIAPDGDTPGTK